MPVNPGREPIDLAHLAQYTGGDPALDSELLRMFSAQCATTLARLASVLAAADGNNWRDAAHSLKGAAAGIGAREVSEWAGRAEGIDPALKQEDARDCLSQLRKRCEIAKAFIDAHLNQ